MSYHEDQAKGRAPKIEMPPLEQEQAAPVEYEVHPALRQAIPDPAMHQEEASEQPEEAANDSVQAAEKEAPLRKKPSIENNANYQALREKARRAEQLERERDELMRRLQENQGTKSQTQEVSRDEDFDLAPDALAEGKHLSKMAHKVKELEKQLKNYQMQSAETLAEQKVKMNYPDFDKVVSPDNIELLRDQFPEIAEMIHNTPDMYKKASSAYTLIKQMGIYKGESYEQEKAVAQKNAAKPKPLASIAPQQGDTPLSRANAFANGLTDDLKEQLRKEMLEARRRM